MEAAKAAEAERQKRIEVECAKLAAEEEARRVRLCFHKLSVCMYDIAYA